MPVHVIYDEGERVSLNKISENSSDFMYFKKDAHTSAYYRVLNAPEQLDKFYSPNMQKMHITVTEGNYKVTGDMSVIPIVEHKDEEIQWSCSMSIYTDTGEPDTFKEATTRPNRHL